MGEIARDNHFVPQALLRRWSHDGQKVYAYRTLVSRPEVPEWERCAIRGLAAHDDLYTTVENNVESDEFERWIQHEFETPGLTALQKVEQAARLTPGDWRALIRLVAAQDVRTPLSYLESAQRWQTQIPETLTEVVKEAEELIREHGRPGVEAEAQRLSRPNHFERSIRVRIEPSPEPSATHSMVALEVPSTRALWIDAMRHLLTETANRLVEHRWSIAVPHGHFEWPLTDHPVVRLNYYAANSYDFKGGWGNPGSEIMMPVSPRYLLYVQVGKKSENRFAFSAEQTTQVQKFLVERAHRRVFATRPDANVSRWRPRVVDEATYREEQLMWARWHELQSPTHAPE